jgi:hypothetical protein
LPIRAICSIKSANSIQSEPSPPNPEDHDDGHGDRRRKHAEVDHQVEATGGLSHEGDTRGKCVESQGEFPHRFSSFENRLSRGLTACESLVSSP